MQTDIKKVSLIILTYNSSKTIRKCLNAIRQINYPSAYTEIIILDNGSKDETSSIIKEMGYTYFFYPNLNLPMLRNKGAELSSGEIIGYIDSDCIVAPDWVRQVVKWFNDPTVGIVGNKYLLPENASYLEKNWYVDNNCEIKRNDLIPAGNMAISKAKFIELGGFDTTLLTGEDAYLLKIFRKKGYGTISDQKVKSIHLGNAKNLLNLYRKEVWYGLGMLGTVDYNSFDKPFLASILMLLFLTTLLSSLIGYIFSFKNVYICAGLISLTGIIGLLFFSAIDRVFFKKRGRNILYIMVIFLVFFIARINSLLYIYKILKYRKA